MCKKMNKLFKEIPIIWLKLLISFIALSAIALRIIFPGIKIDAISIGLIILAFLPWLSELIESAEFPGGWKVKFRKSESIVSKNSDAEIPESIGKSDEEAKFHMIVAAALQYYNAAKFDLAVRWGEEALKIKSNDINLRNWLSIIYGEKLNNKEQAIFHCNKILVSNPKDISAMFNLAVYTNHSKGSDYSLPIYLKVENLIQELKKPQDSEINAKLNLFIGHDYRWKKEKDIPEAKKRYEKAISLFEQRIKNGDETGVSIFWLKDARKNLSELEKENT
jgi:tetratricopeptide (TPR) repeat protein